MKRRPPDRASSHGFSGRSILRVLVIDDDPDDQLILRDLIEDGDGSIVCDVAATYEAGMSAMLRGNYDACLVDYRLGARSGVDLIREMGARSDGPMILLTGVGSHEVDDESLAAGAADYLVKRDLNTETLHRSLRYSVEMWRSRRQAQTDRARYQSLFDGVPVGLFRTTPNGIVLEANATAVSMLGYRDREALIGLRLGDLASAREWFDTELAALGSEQIRSGDRDFDLVREDGTSLWVTFTPQPVVSGDGVIEWVEWAMADITRRKEAELQVTLRGTLLDQVRSAVIVTDLIGVCTFWNRHAEEMYGWQASEAVGRPIAELTVLDDDRGLASEIISEIADTGHWEGEFPVRRRDGTAFVAQVHNAILRDATGRPTGILGVSMDLTATKSREIELRKSQEIVTAAFDSSPIGKAILSVPGGEIVSCNQALASFLGRSIDDLHGSHFTEFTHAEDADVDTKQIADLVGGRVDSYTVDKRFIRSDDTVVWGSLKASLIRDESEQIRYAVGQVIDITAQRAAEDRIRFQASLLDQVHHAVIATDLSGTVTFWNRYAEELYGWSAEEIVGEDIFEMTAPHAGPDVITEVENSLLETGLWEGEVLLRRKDGSTFPALSTDTLLRDAGGDPVGVVGIKVDLSELRQAEQYARQQQALNHTLLDSVNVPIAIVDRDRRVVVSNTPWGRLIEDQSAHLAPCLTERADATVVAALDHGINSVLAGDQNRFTLEYECDIASQPRWIRTVAIPTDDEGAVISHWDITDERTARRTLEETIAAKDQFIASISHELRTPLTVVLGLAETLRSDEVSSDDKEEFQDLLADQTQEIALIVEDLLVAARLDSETLTIRPTDLDLATEVRSVLRPWLRTDGIDISFTVEAGSVLAHADALRVRQIVRNLITNAIRYGCPPITVEAAVVEGEAMVTVVDHGDGIPADAIQRMFQPYSRFGPSEGQPLSVGLGLHVARRLAILMSGDLTYRREDGKTFFVLRLPTHGAAPTDTVSLDGPGHI